MPKYHSYESMTLKPKEYIRNMVKICLLSDTHGYIDDAILTHISACDEVWHAGDIGPSLLDTLEQTRPLRAVYGNIDSSHERIRTSENLVFDLEGKKILITHIAGKPLYYDSRVQGLITTHKPDILICGHSHILQVLSDKKNNLLFINPGAAGVHGFHKMRTLLLFDIAEAKISNMRVVELGLRGKIR